MHLDVRYEGDWKSATALETFTLVDFKWNRHLPVLETSFLSVKGILQGKGRACSRQTKVLVIRLLEEILHQLTGRLSHYLQGFIHPRWCRISEPSTVVRANGFYMLQLRTNSMALESIRGAMGVLMRGNMCTLTTSCDVCNGSHTYTHVYIYIHIWIIKSLTNIV